MSEQEQPGPVALPTAPGLTSERLTVRLFDEILIWPLLIRDSDQTQPVRESLDRWTTLLTSKGQWNWPDDKRDEKTSCQCQEAYEEVVYFHPFVRDFLYGDGVTPPGQRPIRRLQREDIRSVRLTLGYGAEQLVLNVRRIQLYLFETLVALLVIEVDSHGPLPLGSVLEIQDQFRRAYPPFWNEDGSGGKCPRLVEWLDRNGQPIGPPSNFGSRKEHEGFVTIGAEPPVAAHWKWLLEPLVPYEKAQAGPSRDQRGRQEITYQQIEDERIPVMSCLALDKPRELTDGEFMRLTFLDGKGSTVALPYAQGFPAKFFTTYCYDRFWEPAPSQNEFTTRYLCCGYAFTVVGQSSPTGNCFFTNDRDGILAHFRKHYFKLGLIAHFHRASLLMFSYRLAKAVQKLDRRRAEAESVEDFKGAVAGIQKDLLRFRSRYWFTEVSNHVQAQELFHLWSGHLKTGELFDQVLNETRTVNDVLSSQEQARQTTVTTRLTVVATVGLMASLAIAFLSSPLINPSFEHGEWSWDAARQWLGPLCVVGPVMFVLMLFIVCKSEWLGQRFNKVADFGRRIDRDSNASSPDS